MLRFVAAVAMALLAIAGPASAALSIAAVRPPADPIVPDSGVGRVEFDVVVDCGSVVLRSSPPNLAVRNVVFSFAPADGATITGQLTVPLPTNACPVPAGNVTLKAPFDVVVARTLPGLVPLPIDVTAMLDGDPLAPDIAEDDASFTATPAAVVATTIAVAGNLVQCGCPTNVTFELTNIGNVATSYSVEVGSAGQGRLTLPEPFVLQAGATGGTSNGTVRVVYMPPEGAWVQEVALLYVRSHAVDQPATEGQLLSANYLFVNADKDQDSKIPGLSPLAVIGLLGLAAAVTRRRA